MLLTGKCIIYNISKLFQLQPLIHILPHLEIVAEHKVRVAGGVFKYSF
jgi:hypothetical protein